MLLIFALLRVFLEASTLEEAVWDHRLYSNDITKLAHGKAVSLYAFENLISNCRGWGDR